MFFNILIQQGSILENFKARNSWNSTIKSSLANVKPMCVRSYSNCIAKFLVAIIGHECIKFFYGPPIAFIRPFCNITSGCNRGCDSVDQMHD